MKIVRKIEKYRAAAMVEVRADFSPLDLILCCFKLEVLNTIKVNDPSNKERCISIEKWFNYRGHICLVNTLYFFHWFLFAGV